MGVSSRIAPIFHVNSKLRLTSISSIIAYVQLPNNWRLSFPAKVPFQSLLPWKLKNEKRNGTGICIEDC